METGYLKIAIGGLEELGFVDIREGKYDRNMAWRPKYGRNGSVTETTGVV
jgi:hypothetical protein